MEKIKRMLSRISKKQWIIIGAIVLVIIIAIVLLLTLGNDEKKNDVVKEETTTVNDSANIVREATYEGLTINNIVLMTSDDYATFTATVTNNSGETKDIEDFYIVLKKGDEEVVSVYAYLGDALAAGESRDITASVGMKLTKDVVDTAEYRSDK